MSNSGEPHVDRSRSGTRHFGVGLARAVAGSVIFSLPLLMTMEMWRLGFYMDRLRLALLLVLALPLLVGLSHVSGFEETFDFKEDAVDAFVAYAVGFASGAGLLVLFGVVRSGMPLDEITGKVALQAVPGGIGALLAQSQLGGQSAASGGAGGQSGGGAGRGAAESERRRPSSYASQLFLMGVGALFLAFNIAPTEEIVVIAYMMPPSHVLVMMAISLLGMHAFVYALEFQGQEQAPRGTPAWNVFLRFTVVGYAIALAVSGYVLWTFGRLDGIGSGEAVTMVLVLGFPAAIGAAAARLIL